MTVHVRTEMLLEQLGVNREKHIDDFNKKIDSWVKDLKTAMQEGIEKAKEDDVVFAPQIVLNKNPYPVLNTKRYDDVIGKLEWEDRQVLELDDATFNAWVHDKWTTAVNGVVTISGGIWGVSGSSGGGGSFSSRGANSATTTTRALDK